MEEHDISEGDVTFTGHSLGGAIAQYVTTIYEDASGVTFNAPGLMHKLYYNAVHNDFNVADLFKALTGKFDITNYVDEDDWLVGGFGDHIGQTIKLEGSFEVPEFELEHDLSHYVNNWDYLGLLADLTVEGADWSWDLIKEFIIGSHGIDRFYDQFNEAGSAPPPPKDPIILDIDGDGLDTISKEAGANFDHDGDDYAEETGWVGDGDGLLVYDRDGDGKFTDGSELFGDQTPLQNGGLAATGFEALEEFDTNKDGKVDFHDDHFADLRVWIDKDRDGTAEEGETFTLDELGIRSLDTSYENVSVEDGYGNTQIQLGQYEKEDGSVHDMGDYLVDVNPEDSIPINHVEVPLDIRLLPDVFVGGVVHSLSQTMAMDEGGELKQLVESFVNESTLAGRNSLLEEIIIEWAGVQNVEEGSRGEFIDAKKIAALEKFTGRDFVGQDGTSTPNDNAAALLEQSYAELSEFIYARMMSQSHFAEISESFNIVFNEEENTIEVDSANLLELIQDKIVENRESGEEFLIDFTRLIKSFDLQSVLDYEYLRNELIESDPSLAWLMDSAGERTTEGAGDNDYIDGWMKDDAIRGGYSNDNLDGNQGNDFLYGEGDDDYITGGTGNDFLDGGTGHDDLYGNDGDDVLIGREGDDFLKGGKGNDKYVFSLGFGSDVIDDLSYGEDIDTVVFSDIESSRVSLSKQGEDLVLTVGESGDQLVIENYFSSANYRVEKIEFSDGVVWNYDSIYNQPITLHGNESDNTLNGKGLDDTLIAYEGDDELNGNEGNDLLYGGQGNDELNGHQGDDELFGGSGSDKLYGDEGNDELSGNEGDDTLYADEGDDLLQGNEGNDYLNGDDGSYTYLYSKGDGHDTIYDWSSQGTDTLSLIDILPEEVTISREGTDLHLLFKDADDSITITDYFQSSSYRIESIEFKDGTAWDYDMVSSMPALIEGTEGNDTIFSGIGDDRADGDEGDDILYGEEGQDDLNGDSGDDVLHGGADHDELNGGDGHDQLYGEDGNDSIDGDEGNDVLIGGQGGDFLDGGKGQDTYLYRMPIK